MSVTLKQIAEEVGVSQPLVTYALNGRPGVSDTMRLKIQETAERMGYSRASNIEAQYLIARRHGKRPLSGVIALIYPLVDNLPCFLTVPFYRDMIAGLELEVRTRNLDLLITPTCGERIPRIIRDRRVDGVMFLSDMSELSPHFLDLDLPMISLCTRNETTYNLVPDDENGGYDAAKHLLKLGHRKIAFSGTASFQGNARLAGYKRALAEYGVGLDENLIWMPPLSFCREEDGGISMKALLDRSGKRPGLKPGFTAIICQNDLIGMGAARVAQEEGLQTPKDMSIVGFDDVSVQHNFQPALTSVSYPRYDIGRYGVDWLCGEIAALAKSGGPVTGYQTQYGVKTFPTTLVVRESTCAVAC